MYAGDSKPSIMRANQFVFINVSKHFVSFVIQTIGDFTTPNSLSNNNNTTTEAMRAKKKIKTGKTLTFYHPHHEFVV